MGKPSAKALGKRKAAGPPQKAGPKKGKPAKGANEEEPSGKPKRKADQPKKIKLRDQKVIPVPKTTFAYRPSDDEDMDDLGEEDEYDVGAMGSFLGSVDQNALSRSAKETRRLHDQLKAREPIAKREKQQTRLPSPGSDRSSDYDIGSDASFDSDLDSLGSDLEEEEEQAEGSASASGSSTLDEEEEDADDSDDEDQDDLNDAFDDLPDGSKEDGSGKHDKRKRKRKDEEAEYELSGRSRWAAKPAPAEEDDHVDVGRLPIKLPTGEVQNVEGSTRIALPPSKKKAPPPESETEEEVDEESDGDLSDDAAQAAKMAGQKGRFGRMGVAEIVSQKEWKIARKLEAAKEQIAGIGAEVMAGGELVDNGPLLTRLSTFALPSVPSIDDSQKSLPVPASIRGLALLSQLAVYKDLIPGYRIRQLTAQEEAERVRDEVKRLREGEKLLVRSYKGYLKMLEAEVKARSALSSLCLKCLSELLSSVPHFNFSENIMGVLVGRLGRRSWDDDSDLILQTFVDVFKADITAVYSQSLVRLIARMIKERKFQVHPNVLSCLLQLRLRGELDSMRDGKNKRPQKGQKGDVNGNGKKFKSEIRKKWQTKNQKKREKEQKEVEKELAEAEAEVDKEERAQVQTETLKNLFVLYFSILKHPGRSPLLGAALEGISQFAHFINVDFFRDLLAVLRRIIIDEPEAARLAADDDDERGDESDAISLSEKIRIRLLAIATAFDLLSGQGEALNIDLSDFITALFALLRPISLDTGLEDPPTLPMAASAQQRRRREPVQLLSTADLLFRCLQAIFFSKHSTAATNPSWRAAAFSKRLIECSLQFPPKTAKRSVEFVRALFSRQAQLEGLLDTEERMFDGVYRPEQDDPQLVNTFSTSLYELDFLATRHVDADVRKEAEKLRDGSKV